MEFILLGKEEGKTPQTLIPKFPEISVGGAHASWPASNSDLHMRTSILTNVRTYIASRDPARGFASCN